MLCYLSFCPCCFLYFIFVFNFHHFDYYVSWCVPPWVYLALDFLCFLDLVDYFPMLGKFSAIISSNIFSSPFSLFWDPYRGPMWMLVLIMFSQSSLRQSSFFSFFFLYSVPWQWFPPFYPPDTYLFFCITYSAIDSFSCILHLCLFVL